MGVSWRRPAVVLAMRGELDFRQRLALHAEVDLRLEVRKLVGKPRGFDCDCARRIKAEEPHARIGTVATNVSAYVHFVKGGYPGQSRHHDGADSAESERDQTDPGLALMDVDRETGREKALQLLRRHLPVQEEKVAPILMHDRWLIHSPVRSKLDATGSA